MFWIILIRLVAWAVVASVAGCVVLYGIRYYELATTGFRPPLRGKSLSFPALAGAVGMLAREWGTWWVLTLIRPFGWGARSTRLQGSGGGRPVILMPGFLMNRSCLYFIAKRIARGRSAVHILNYRTHADMREVASDLAYYVEDVCRETGQSHVDIVAYSMGGLVTRYYVERLGGSARVRRVVTMGSPHHGTKLAVFSHFVAAHQMQPASEFLADVHAAGLSDEVSYTSVYSDADPFLLPPTTAQLPDPARNVHIEGLGHGGLLLSRRFAVPVLEALGIEVLPKPAARKQVSAS